MSYLAIAPPYFYEHTYYYLDGNNQTAKNISPHPERAERYFSKADKGHERRVGVGEHRAHQPRHEHLPRLPERIPLGAQR